MYSLLHLERHPISMKNLKSHWSLLNGTWQKRPRKQENRLGFEIEQMKLQMYSLLHLGRPSFSISNLNRIGPFSTERGE